MKTAYEQGLEWGSCPEALEMRKNYATQVDWYKNGCQRGDWAIWNLERLSKTEFEKIKPALLRAINVITDRAVKNYALHCGIADVEKWAENWLNGTDKNAADAADAAHAAGAAHAAVATFAAFAAFAVATFAAARAADAAADAAFADARDRARAADAAFAAELKLQADDIHKEIPEWPGEGER